MRPLATVLLLLAAIPHMARGQGQMQGAKKSKMVTTLLDARWPSVPFVLEAAEFMAEENPRFFWEVVDHLADEESILATKTDKEIYDQIISFCSRYLTASQFNLLKLSLSLRMMSPRLEMFQQLAMDRGVHEKLEGDATCQDFVVEISGKRLVCSREELNDDSSFGSGEAPHTIKADHHYPKRNDGRLLVLYAEPGKKGFAAIHQYLKKLASEGMIDYVLRPFLRTRSGHRTRLSGYGVELQIKSTEYKAQDDRKVDIDGSGMAEHGTDDSEEDSVGGFIFSRLNDLHPDSKEKLADLKQYLLDQNNDMAPLKVWQVQDLSLQAAERVLDSPKEKQLKVLTDLAQNFPSQARTLSRTTVRKELKKEVKRNQENFLMNMNIQPSDAALFINGMFFDMEFVDIFTLFDVLRSEGRILDSLGRLGLTDEQARNMISEDMSSSKQSYGMDIRDSAIHWINNIEKDSMYAGWSQSVTELLRPTFPGMLRSIRRNFFNLVMLCNPAKRESRPLLKLLESFYVHRAPTRIGLVFVVDDSVSLTGEKDVGVAFVEAFNFITINREPQDALAFITDVYARVDANEDVQVDDVHQVFLENYGSDVKPEDIFGPDSEYDIGRQGVKDFIERTSFKTFPQVLMNGVPIDSKYLNSEDFEEGIMISLMKTTNDLQIAVYKNMLKDSDDVTAYLMKQPNIMPRLNDRILSGADSSRSLNMIGDVLPVLKLDPFSKLDNAGQSATMAEHLNYLTQRRDPNKLYIFTVWLVVDLETKQGRDILRGALEHLKESSLMRIGLIQNAKKPGLMSKAAKGTMMELDSDAARHLLAKISKEDVLSNLQSGKKHLKDYDIPGADMSLLAAKVEATTNDDFAIESLYAEAVLGLLPGQNMIVANGRLIGPLDADERFGTDDFNLLEKFLMSQYGEKMINNYYSFMDVKVTKVSDQAMKVISLLTSQPKTSEGSKSRKTISFTSEKHSVVKIDPKFPDRPAFDIVAIIDPVSQGAQKIAPLLQVLSSVVNAQIRVFLNCVEKHSELPQKSYFRLVLEPELTFSAKDGSLTSGPMAKFGNLPEEPIFTMHYHIPDNWLIQPVKSVYDMDNIKLASASGNVHSEYELEYLLLEGHCFEAFSGNPPRGLQLTLGTEKEAVTGDTIVMANLGYLQLKSNPGRWFLNLRDGRSSDLYEIQAHEGTEKESSVGKDIPVIIDSFKSKIIKLKVQKKPDKRHEELLESDSLDSSESNGGIWDSLRNTFSSSSRQDADKSSDDDSGKETLNIFCLASGHLYERLLKIMMLSTIRHTKAPVKFWILKNYLSPAIKDFLPEFARRYGFDYEYVQYKWPRWLNQQKEKQRIIWGYKILFLDVMFPLDVKKIIFVDTDQIVRADLTELRDMNLKGAPYGYTPFCDSNKEMEGFRFWKSGYWKNHLAGKPYHISALYVVDLVKFRQVAAGDRLRGQYQALSQDPNSLANLDQDLPNNMIHQVPIFSLPQEWLWCETWCDQNSKKKAKSIDLCNNPLTKESKLDAARRIVSEWTEYDDEMEGLTKKIKNESNDAREAKDDDSLKHTEL